MRILISDDLSAESKTILERIPGAQVDFKTGLKPAELKEIIGGYDALAVRSATKVTAEILAAAGKLKVIGRAGTGVDNIDLAAATRRGVVVMNAPGGNSISVAEHTLALVLALARQIPDASSSTRGGKWEKKKFASGRELFGKTLGVVGTGAIGSLVIERARAFGMKVIGYDPVMTAEAAGRMNMELVSLDELFKRADAVTLHVPLTDQTKNMVDANRLASMKPSALLVNCARGGLVDELALASALKAGKLAGAALDVFEQEPPAADHPLFSCPNFIATPHLGGSTEDAQDKVAVIVCESMVAYLTQGTIRNAVNVPSVAGETLQQLLPWMNLGAKLGSFAAQISSQGSPALHPETLQLTYAGEVASLPTGPITAAILKGLLGHFLTEPVNEVSGAVLAKERGIKVTEARTTEAADFASLVSIELRGEGAVPVMVSGTIVGKRTPRIVRVGAFELEASPEGALIVIHNADAPGVVGNVGHALGEAGVNIAELALARDRSQGEALALVNVDSPASAAVLDKLRKLLHVHKVTQVVL